jgi:DNA polymerase elongation subunit (family B)
MGFEAKRSDAFPLLARAQTEATDIIINGSLDWNKVSEDVLKYLGQLKLQLFAGELDKELIQEKTLKKESLADYETEDGKGLPPHVRAAKQLAALGVLRMGDQVGYVVTTTESGKQVVTAIDPREPEKIPYIRTEGYRYYYERLSDMIGRLLGRDPDLMFERDILGYT